MRRFATLLHRYTGLLFGVFLLISSVTGMLIVFAKPIDAQMNGDLLQVTSQSHHISIDTLLESVRAAAPARTVSSVFIPQSPDLAWEFWFQGDDHFRVYADPYAGAVTGMREVTDSLMGFLIDLHIHLLAGDTGEIIMGWAGLAGIFITLVGIYLWWPKLGNWKKAFSIKWQAAPIRVWLDIHKVVGICMSALIILTIATGSALALYDIVTEPILKALTGEETREPFPVSRASGGPDAPIAPMLEQAKRVFPNGHLSRISFPAAANGPVVIRMRLEGEVHQVGRTFLFFDRYDGSLLKSSSAFEANSAVRIQNWFYPLHTGFYGGTATRVLQIFVGLSLASLMLSGTWLWWRGWRARRVAAARSLKSGIRA
jgi:uncharacterized iron-regulated membrane protein